MVAVTIAPWLFGSVQPRVQVGLFVALVIAMGAWLVYQWAHRRASEVLSWSVVPLFLAVGLGVLQLIPVDRETLARVSPRAAELRSTLMSENNPSDAAIVERLGLPAIAQRQPISLYPASTRVDLALLVLAVSAFVLGATLFAGRRSSRWLCVVVAINGAALALFGLVQQLTFNGRLYWRVPLTQGGSPFGPFVNRNNAGGFLLLCLACALGVVVWAFRRSGFMGSSSLSLRITGDSLPHPWWVRPWPACREFVARLDAWTLVALGLAGCLVAGVFCSLSRGAMVAMIGGALCSVLVALLARRRQARLAWLGLVAIAGMGLVAWVGMSDSVRARLGTLLDYAAASQGRVTHWRDGVQAAPDFWRLGSGLGTYRFIYEPYQREPAACWYYHAEDQYLEGLVEAGVPGLALMMSMIVLIGTAGWRLVRHGLDQDTFALGLVGVFALSSQAIHAVSDFGLYIPANAVLFAVLCGSVAGRAATLRHEALAKRPDRSPQSRAPASRLLTTCVAAGAMAALIWGCMETSHAAAVEVAMKHVDSLTPEARLSLAPLGEAVRRLDETLQQRPDDALGLCCLASLQIQLYRVGALERLRREAGSGADHAALWQGTLPLVVHARAQQLARASLDRTLQRLRNQPVIAENLVPAMKSLVRARRACPLLPQVHLAIAQLSVLVSAPADNQVHLDRAQETSPCQADVAFQCGLLAYQAGRMDTALASWRDSLTRRPSHLREILQLVNSEPDLPGNLEKLLPDSPMLLIQLAREQYLGDRYARLRSRLLERAAESTENKEYSEAERHHVKGMVFALRNRFTEAIESYSRAVELRRENARWRYELALLLQREGRLEQAHEEAKYCFRSDPANGDYRKLLEEINHTRAMTFTRLP